MLSSWLIYVNMSLYVYLATVSSQFQHLSLINYAMCLFYFSCYFLISKMSSLDLYFLSLHSILITNVISSHIMARKSISIGRLITKANSGARLPLLESWKSSVSLVGSLQLSMPHFPCLQNEGSDNICWGRWL